MQAKNETKKEFYILYWNVKYFGTNSPNYAAKCQSLADVVNRYKPDIVAFVELTSTAENTMKEIRSKLKTDTISYLDTILFEAGGGNKEHYGVLVSTSFGFGLKMEGCGVRLGGGTRKVGQITFSNPPWIMYLCHPSPCQFTSNVVVPEATSIVQRHNDPAIMIGDFNTKDLSGPGVVAPSASTFQSQSSGSLKTLDGAVGNSNIDVSVENSERVTKDIASDHAWILFKVSF